MNHIYGVNKYTYARYCTETDIFLLPELDPDRDLVVNFPDPDPTKRSGSDRIRIRIRIRNTAVRDLYLRGPQEVLFLVYLGRRVVKVVQHVSDSIPHVSQLRQHPARYPAL